MDSEKKLILSRGRDHSVLRRHPWIFSGAVKEISGNPESGDTVSVYSAGGDFLGRAGFSPESNIRARIWTFDRSEAVDGAFFRKRVHEACRLRARLGFPVPGFQVPEGVPVIPVNACRLIHGEADGLPAVVADLFGEYLTCQFLSAPAERWKQEIAAALHEELPEIKGIYERSEAEARKREGLAESSGLLWGEEPPPVYEIEEHGIRLGVDLMHGHKTGYYLDQRLNRQNIMPFCRNRTVLDCCCYSGGFGLRALQAGAAEVTFLDAAESALDLARRNAAANGFPEEKCRWVHGDIFTALRKFRDCGKSFDVIILDPPKFAETHARLEKASRGYKDINLLGFKLLRPEGHLFTFSCSAAVTPELFCKIVGDAARDMGGKALLMQSFEQDADHPQALDFPEGNYLTGIHSVLQSRTE